MDLFLKILFLWNLQLASKKVEQFVLLFLKFLAIYMK